jgi:phosphotransferase system  glucose/maltose/N-acetylglucosamine-specific IIC component
VKAIGCLTAIFGVAIIAIFGLAAMSVFGRALPSSLQSGSHGTLLFAIVLFWIVFVGLALVYYGLSFSNDLHTNQRGKALTEKELEVPARFRDEKLLKVHSEVAAGEFLHTLPVGNINRTNDENTDT